jgi:hypothetical protein
MRSDLTEYMMSEAPTYHFRHFEGPAPGCDAAMSTWRACPRSTLESLEHRQSSGDPSHMPDSSRRGSLQKSKAKG